MYITCPNCQTNFIVLPEQIGQNGRRVKCSKCLHIWYYNLRLKIINENTLDQNKEQESCHSISGNGISESQESLKQVEDEKIHDFHHDKYISKLHNEVVSPIHDSAINSPKQHFHWQSITNNSNLPVLVIPKKTNYHFIIPIILSFIISGLLLIIFASDLQQRYLVHKTLSVQYLGVAGNQNSLNSTIHYRISNNTQSPEVVPLILLQVISADDKVIDHYYLNPAYITLDKEEYIDFATTFSFRHQDVKSVNISLIDSFINRFLTN